MNNAVEPSLRPKQPKLPGWRRGVGVALVLAGMLLLAFTSDYHVAQVQFVVALLLIVAGVWLCAGLGFSRRKDYRKL
ncbi:MAG: hypothetical protein DME97_00090 [Verrucomicrobia bacterium]|nr:MAG: hypothetical protein DME97_00090 [Verrucomicrobiota bacterium]